MTETSLRTLTLQAEANVEDPVTTDTSSADGVTASPFISRLIELLEGQDSTSPLWALVDALTGFDVFFAEVTPPLTDVQQAHGVTYSLLLRLTGDYLSMLSGLFEDENLEAAVLEVEAERSHITQLVNAS